MHGRPEDTADQIWQKKGKKYKTKYFAALKELFGKAEVGEKSLESDTTRAKSVSHPE